MWPNPQESEEIINGKLHFLCIESMVISNQYFYYSQEL